MDEATGLIDYEVGTEGHDVVSGLSTWARDTQQPLILSFASEFLACEAACVAICGKCIPAATCFFSLFIYRSFVPRTSLLQKQKRAVVELILAELPRNNGLL